MAFPLLIPMLLAGGSAIANKIGSNKQTAANAAALGDERGRQNEFQLEAEGLVDRSRARYDGFGENQAERGAALGDYFHAQGAGAQGPVPSMAPARVRSVWSAGSSPSEMSALAIPKSVTISRGTADWPSLLLSGRRALVSTATKALQDQLFLRDLPRLTQALKLPARLALLKGRSSYLCLHRLRQARDSATLPDRFAVRALARIEQWATATRTGDHLRPTTSGSAPTASSREEAAEVVAGAGGRRWPVSARARPRGDRCAKRLRRCRSQLPRPCC